MPEFTSRAIDDGWDRSFVSSKSKLNYQVDTGEGILPLSSDNVIPI